MLRKWDTVAGVLAEINARQDELRDVFALCGASYDLSRPAVLARMSVPDKDAAFQRLKSLNEELEVLASRYEMLARAH